MASNFMKALTNTFINFSFALICEYTTDPSLICGSSKLQHFSQLRCCVNIWPYQKILSKI